MLYHAHVKHVVGGERSCGFDIRYLSDLAAQTDGQTGGTVGVLTSVWAAPLSPTTYFRRAFRQINHPIILLGTISTLYISLSNVFVL